MSKEPQEGTQPPSAGGGGGGVPPGYRPIKGTNHPFRFVPTEPNENTAVMWSKLLAKDDTCNVVVLTGLPTGSVDDEYNADGVGHVWALSNGTIAVMGSAVRVRVTEKNSSDVIVDSNC